MASGHRFSPGTDGAGEWNVRFLALEIGDRRELDDGNEAHPTCAHEAR
jgi:hypothetical protein